MTKANSKAVNAMADVASAKREMTRREAAALGGLPEELRKRLFCVEQSAHCAEAQHSIRWYYLNEIEVGRIDDTTYTADVPLWLESDELEEFCAFLRDVWEDYAEARKAAGPGVHVTMSIELADS